MLKQIGIGHHAYTLHWPGNFGYAHQNSDQKYQESVLVFVDPSAVQETESAEYLSFKIH